MATDIRSRDDLSFIACTAAGELIHWEPHHDFDTRDDAFRYGIACVDAIAKLARVDEAEALDVMRRALLSPDWNTDCGEEQGFIDAMLRAALNGWRAPMTPAGIDQAEVRWRSLHSRLTVIEARIGGVGMAGAAAAQA